SPAILLARSGPSRGPRPGIPRGYEHGHSPTFPKLMFGSTPFRLLALAVVAVGLLTTTAASGASQTRRAYLPNVPHAHATATPTPIPTATPDPACPSTGQSYELIPTDGRYQVSNPGSAAPPLSPDLNLTVRGWLTVDEARTLVDYNGGTDSAAPQLFSLF